MNAFESLGIEEAAGVADDECAVYVGAGHRVPAAVGERFGAIADEFAPFENFFEKRMRLPGLKRGVRIELRVGVFEREDEADREAIVGEAVDPAAAVHARGDGPAERVSDVSWLNAIGLDVPELLDADAVGLRIDVVEFFRGDEIFGERAARAFGEDGDFGAEFVAGSEIVFGLAVFVEAFVFGDDAGDAVAFVNQRCAAKFFEDVDASGFDEPAEPFCELAKRNDVVAFVLKRRRSDGKTERGVFGEEESNGIGDRCVEGSGFFEAGDKLGKGFGIHDGAGELMRADFAAFFEDVNIFGGERRLGAGVVVLLDQIGEMQGARETGRACADDQDIGFELFALDGHGLCHLNKGRLHLAELLETAHSRGSAPASGVATPSLFSCKCCM